MAAGSADQPPDERPAEERYGPLAIGRMSKDDGRSLILYSHDEDGGESAPAPASDGGRA